MCLQAREGCQTCLSILCLSSSSEAALSSAAGITHQYHYQQPRCAPRCEKLTDPLVVGAAREVAAAGTELRRVDGCLVAGEQHNRRFQR